MPPRAILYRLLSRVFAEIGARGQEQGNKRLFLLADLFSDLPLRLEQAMPGERSYSNLLVVLRDRAAEKGLAGWLEHAIGQVTNWHPPGGAMADELLLHRLLTAALIDLRVQADDTKNQELLDLAHVVSDIPSDLMAVGRGGWDYDKVLGKVRARALGRPSEAWLSRAMQEATVPSVNGNQVVPST